jgi:hypothetical protein
VRIGDKRASILAPIALAFFTCAMANPGEAVFLPCQFCRRLARRDARSATRAVTCFECRTERIRQASKANYQRRNAGCIDRANDTNVGRKASGQAFGPPWSARLRLSLSPSRQVRREPHVGSTCHQNTGAVMLEATQALNQRGIRTTRGAKWYASSVMNVLERASALREAPALL